MTSQEQIFRKFYLGTSECDMNGFWKISSLLEAVHNVTNEHSKILHMWHHDLSGRNMSWVLFRTEIKVFRYPGLGDTVEVQSFMNLSRSVFHPRYFLIRDEQGEIIAQVGSLLMLMDLTTRKTVSIMDAGINIPITKDVEPPFKISLKQKKISGEINIFEYVPRYSDLDVNRHVNNVKYAEWLCNSLGCDRLGRYEIAYISIDYNHEILPDEQIKMHLCINENDFQFSGFSGERCSFRITGTLRNQEKGKTE